MSIIFICVTIFILQSIIINFLLKLNSEIVHLYIVLGFKSLYFEKIIKYTIYIYFYVCCIICIFYCSRMYGFLKLNDPKEEKKKTLVLKVCIFFSLITYYLYYNAYYFKN